MLLIIAFEIVVGVLGIIAFLSLLLIVFRNYLGVFDKVIINWIYTFRSEGVNDFMKAITFFGDGIVLISGILLLLGFIYKKHKISTFNFAVLLVFGTVINLLLKFVYQRPRPDFFPLMFESTYSFPSGHAMNSFIFYACLAYFINRNTKSRKIRIYTVAFFGLLVLLIGVSRIYLGVHYPSDVLAGYIAGILWFAVIVVVERTAHKLTVFK